MEPLFASVEVVARHAQPDIAGLEHTLMTIDAFMGVAERWTVVDACEIGSKRLLRQVMRRSHKSDEAELRTLQFRRALELAAASGDVEMIELLVSEFEPEATITTAVREAAKAGSLEVLQWLASNCSGRVQWTSEEWVAAASAGRLDVLKWLFASCQTRKTSPSDITRLAGELIEIATQNGDLPMLQWIADVTEAVTSTPVRCPTSAMTTAAENGHLELVQWIASRGLLRSNIPIRMDLVAANNHVDVLQYFHANAKGFFLPRTMDEAARNGHLDAVKWLSSNRSEGCSRLAMDLAAANGHLTVVQWLHENRQEGCSTLAMDAAAANGHFEVVQWLHSNRGEGCTTQAMDSAAAYGHLEILLWLHKHRSEGCTPYAMADAVRFNRIDVMEWLLANIPKQVLFPTTISINAFNYASALSEAAANGNLQALQWFHNNELPDGRPWSRYVMDNAAKAGHLEIVRWLHENRADGCTANAMDWAAGGGHLDVVQWLHENREEGCTMSAMDDAAARGHLHVVQWLNENRQEGCTVRAMDDAAGNGHLDVLLFLRRARHEGCSSTAAVKAASYGHLEVLQWLSRFFPTQFASFLRLRRLAMNETNANGVISSVNGGECNAYVARWLASLDVVVQN